MKLFKSVTILFFIALTNLGNSQITSIKIEGYLIDFYSDSKLKSGRIQVFTDGEKVSTQATGEKGKYSFDLELGKDYMLVFMHSNYMSKKIAFNAANANSNNVTEFQKFKNWKVTLIPEVEGADVSVLDEPSGEMNFNESTGEFDWNAKVHAVKSEQIRTLEEEVAAKLEKGLQQLREAVEYINRGKEPLNSKMVYTEREIEQLNNKLEKDALKYPTNVTEKSYMKESAFIVLKISDFNSYNDVEFRAVKHDWGGEYYFRNGISITRTLFLLGTLTQEEFLKQNKVGTE